MDYNNRQYESEPEKSEFSCDGCAFLYRCKRIVNVGQKTKPEFKEVETGQQGCSAPNIEPFRSCKHDHVIYKQITQV